MVGGSSGPGLGAGLGPCVLCSWKDTLLYQHQRTVRAALKSAGGHPVMDHPGRVAMGQSLLMSVFHFASLARNCAKRHHAIYQLTPKV